MCFSLTNQHEGRTIDLISDLVDEVLYSAATGALCETQIGDAPEGRECGNPLEAFCHTCREGHGVLMCLTCADHCEQRGHRVTRIVRA
jgi:hypothetical protein